MAFPEDVCSRPLPPEVLRGIQLFNAGLYFEAHEALETAWRSELGPLRDLYRGILQVGVAYFHLMHGNYTGACKMFRRARIWLYPFPAQCCGIDLMQLRQDAGAVEQAVLRLGPSHVQEFEKSMLKPLSYHPIEVDP